MKTFHRLLVYALIASTTNNFVWFGLTFFAYLETRSVITTGIIGGTYLVAASLSGFWLGSLVDHYRKKHVLIGSSLVTLLFFTAGLLLFLFSPIEAFSSLSNPKLWFLILLLLVGVIAGNIIGIAIPSLVTQLIPEKERDKANGKFGTVMGVSFALTSVASGAVLGFLGMQWVLLLAVLMTVIAFVVLILIPLSEDPAKTDEQTQKKIDLIGTYRVVRKIPGLFALIFFTTFNNLLGGVFMALMDAYGLSLLSVQAWGLMWGMVSFGFIIGGVFIAKKGLGKNPLRTLFLVNSIVWIQSILFVIQPSIILLFFGTLIWMSLFPFIEATEQTIIQKVVPPARQGRVFGFAQSIEQAASPLTAFFIGPLTQLFFIPFMTNGEGAQLIGSWFGTGPGRGIALVFILAGVIGLVVTLLAMRSSSYRLLSQRYGE